MPTGDPIEDLQKGVADSEIKKRYSLKDNDLFTLRKYNYLTTKGGLSSTDALEIYPEVSKFVSKKGNVTTTTTEPIKSTKDILPATMATPQAQESTTIVQPQQSVEKLHTEARNQQNAQQATEVGYALQQAMGAKRVEQQTGVPAALQREHALTLEQYNEQNAQPSLSATTPYEQQLRTTELANQAKADKFNQSLGGKLYYNLVQPVVKAVADQGVKLAVGAARINPITHAAIGDKFDEVANTTIDAFDLNSRTMHKEGTGPGAFLFSTPTSLHGDLMNDGKVNATQLLPKTIESLAGIYMLVQGGEALGGGKAGLFASNFLTQKENYRKQGEDAGLKEGQLDNFANISAGLSSLLFTAIPEQALQGKFSAEVTKDAIKSIKDGVSVKEAVNAAVKTWGKENGKMALVMNTQNAVDHAIRAGVNVESGQQVFHDDNSFEGIVNEMKQTTLMSVLPTTLLMGHGMLNHYKPDNMVKSAMFNASQNLPEFYRDVDAEVATGKYSPEQGQTIKDNIGIFSTKLNQVQQLGFSPDQATRIAWNTYKDGKINQHTQAVNDNPILKSTIGEEIKKDQEVLKNDIKDAALGIPEVGTEISGEDLTKIVQNTPNSGQKIIDAVKDKNFRVDEINLKEKYDSDPAFKAQVDNFEKTKQDEEGLRTPAIVDTEGKVLDGNKRLVQQYVNGEQTARVFQELKPIQDVTIQKQSPSPLSLRQQAENGKGVGEENQVNQIIAQQGQKEVQQGQVISGITPEEQQKIIADRKAKWNLSERQAKVNGLIEDAAKFNKLNQRSPDRPAMLNDIKARAAEVGITFDPRSGKFKNATGGKVQARHMDVSNQSIIENHVPLHQRPTEVQDNFSQVYQAAKESNLPLELAFPNDIKGVDGRTLSDTQLKQAVNDVANGVPSAGAEAYLNEFEGMIKNGQVRLNADGQSVQIPLAEYMATMQADKQTVDAMLNAGELSVPDDVIKKWMEDEINNTDFETSDNIDNLPYNGTADISTQTNPQEQGAATPAVPQPEPATPGADIAGNLQQTGQEGNAASEAAVAYSEVAGMKPTVVGNRISVAPIIGGEIKDLSKIILDLSTGLKQNIFYLKPKAGRAAGTYAPGGTAIKIRYTGDLDTTAHEIGHALDDRHNIIPDILSNPAASAELNKFQTSAASKPPKGHPDPAKYIAGEGFAEFVRARIANPVEAGIQAPELTKIFEAKVPEKSKKAIDQFSIDYRSFRGGTGRDITLANIEWKPQEKQGMIGEILKPRKDGKEFHISWVDKIAANFINPLQAFEKSIDYLKKIKGIPNVLPEDNPIILARLLLGVDGKFGKILEDGMIDSENNLLQDADGNAKNLKWLLEPLNNQDEKTITTDMKDTMAYMVSERTVELAKRFGREDLLSGVGGGLFSDLEVAKKTLDEFNNGDPDRLARIQKAGERYREFADDILKYMVDKGRMSKEQYDLIKKDNTQYVAMKRILESEPGQEIVAYRGAGGGKLGSVATPIKKIGGSTRKISNPYVSLLDVLHRSINEADRNDMMVAFRDLVYENRGMNVGETKRLADIGVIGEGDNSITIFKDGKPEKWIFNQDIYKALNGLDHDGYKFHPVITFPAKLLRNMTTKFPTFAVRNWIRDLQDRIIKTNEGSGFRDLVGNPKDWSTLEKTGGLSAGYYQKDKATYFGLMEEAMKGVEKNKRFILADPSRLKTLWHKYEGLLFKSETANRVAEYRAAFRKGKGQGMDDYNASLYGAFKARDLVDFGVAGHTMRMINQVIPFSNAAVQGIRSSVVRLKANPAGFIGRTMLYSVLPQMAMWWFNHRNDDDAKEYEALPAYQRDMFWNFKIGDNNWVAMPKPYELSLTGASIDRALSEAWGNDKAFEGFGGSVAQASLPFNQASIIGPYPAVVENLMNKDLFRQKYIVPPDQDALKLSLRNTQTASRLGQIIQDIAGIDARKADHFIRSQFSYVGNAAMKLSDIDKKGSNNRFDLTDIGFFKHSPAYNSQPVQDFLEFANSNGLTQSKQFKTFSALSKKYFAAETESQKDELAKTMREKAKSIMAEWEKTNVSGKKQKKIDAKKAKALP